MPSGSTTVWNDVMELARNLGAKKLQISNYDVRIAQLVAARMYTYRPWSWTTVNTPQNSIILLTGIQDYPAPNDLYDLTQAWITVTYPQPNGLPFDPFNPSAGGSPDQNYNLDVVENLTPDLNPSGLVAAGAITHIANYNLFRLAQAPQVPNSPPQPYPPPPSQSMTFLNATYQPKMEKVTDMSIPLPCPDEYAQVAVDGCLYWLYKFGDDERAGTTVKQGNAIEYTGQLGAFEAGLMGMAANDQQSEVDTFFPSSGLGHRWNYGPYPYIWVS